MKKIAQYVLYAWSAVLFLLGLDFWVGTLGTVHGSEFAMQISIVNGLGAIMMWIAIFGFWYMLPEKKGVQV